MRFLTALLFFSVLYLSAQSPVSLVDPFIGTAGHGHTYPGATLPFGGVQLSPDTGDEGWDWCSGYQYSDRSVMGFSHTHLSGTGISDLADVLLMPHTGTPHLLPGLKDDPDAGYRSRFDHGSEVAEPGYYAVTLADYGIRAELTVDEQWGYHRYTFPASDSAHIVVDLLHGLDRHRSWLTERVLDSELRIINSFTLAGYRRSTGWAHVQDVYFQLRFSKPFRTFGLATNGVFRPQSTLARGRNIQGLVSFSTREGETIEVTAILSHEPFPDAAPIAVGGAGKSFDEVRAAARSTWSTALSPIQIEAPDSVKKIFYTALYHTALAPNRLIGARGDTVLTTLSQWDTYRAAFALHTLIRPRLTEELLRTLLKDHRRNGYLPVWKLWQDEVNTMIGAPSVPIVAEAVRKGFGQDIAYELYAAVRASVLFDNPVAPWTFFNRHGYVPNDVGENFSVSKTLEMCYASACAAEMARSRGDTVIASGYDYQSRFYRNLFDPDVGFFRGRDRAGNWTPDFDPTVTNERDFVEATPWQYGFHLQHDPAALAELYGGRDALADKLDSLFLAGGPTIDEHILDITGLIGQYAHGNEPSHHVAYLYNSVGQPHKTQERIGEICRRFYTTRPDGLCGNEDCGQLSAWYIFSALGFYPVHPASATYELGIPQVERAVIRVPDGGNFRISVAPFGPEYRYVKAVYLNGKRLRQSTIDHRDIVAGGELRFELSTVPEQTF
jgi:predicted alpha-1,2-mannosidase